MAKFLNGKHLQGTTPHIKYIEMSVSHSVSHNGTNRVTDIGNDGAGSPCSEEKAKEAN